jgi:hypothetical protein
MNESFSARFVCPFFVWMPNLQFDARFHVRAWFERCGSLEGFLYYGFGLGSYASDHGPAADFTTFRSLTN